MSANDLCWVAVRADQGSFTVTVTGVFPSYVTVCRANPAYCSASVTSGTSRPATSRPGTLTVRVPPALRGSLCMPWRYVDTVLLRVPVAAPVSVVTFW
ncbi:hypothetical protein SCALM49S_02192 [Streptomyces californicus]